MQRRREALSVEHDVPRYSSMFWVARARHQEVYDIAGNDCVLLIKSFGERDFNLLSN